MVELPIATVIRIAKQNGAERVGKDAAQAIAAKTEKYIGKIVKDAQKLANHAGRKTIKEEDIELAVKEA